MAIAIQMGPERASFLWTQFFKWPINILDTSFWQFSVKGCVLSGGQWGCPRLLILGLFAELCEAADL